MINILLSGCNGKMGQVISKLVVGDKQLKIAAGYDINDNIQNDYPVFTKLSDCTLDINVIIDFSNPAALNGILDYAVSNKIPLIVATTGLSNKHVNSLNNASKYIPVFFSANMSLAMNLLYDLVKRAAKILENSFDIEIIEKHHNQKIDAPSGTALAIADALNTALKQKHGYVYDRHSKRKKRNKNEIGIHAVRGGTIAGDHSVIFAGNDEILEIKHTAMSKEIFAVGALRAAKFILGKHPGLYSMENLIKSA